MHNEALHCPAHVPKLGLTRNVTILLDRNEYITPSLSVFGEGVRGFWLLPLPRVDLEERRSRYYSENSIAQNDEQVADLSD